MNINSKLEKISVAKLVEQCCSVAKVYIRYLCNAILNYLFKLRENFWRVGRTLKENPVK